MDLSGLRFLNHQEIKEIEPYVAGIRGIFVPQTGIIDYNIVSAKLLDEVLDRGGQIFFNEKVKSITCAERIKH